MNKTQGGIEAMSEKKRQWKKWGNEGEKRKRLERKRRKAVRCEKVRDRDE